MLISTAYREQNERLHAERADYGRRGAIWSRLVAELVKDEGHGSILDYGAGKCTLAAALPDLPIACYDPCIPGIDGEPQPADLVVCTDVLEHIERRHLNAVLRDLKRLARRKLFVNIATRPARKTLPDGRNAHLIVQPAKWWKDRLNALFHVITWEVKSEHVFGELVPRAAPLRPFRRPTKRRPLPPSIVALFDHVRTQAAKYNDVFNRLDSIRMWEGVGDEPADMQCISNLLEDWPDPDDALAEVCQMAQKAVMIAITLGDNRTAGDWRKILENRLRIAEWSDMGKQILAVGAPSVKVQGVVPMGAVSHEDRWAQVEAAIKRIPRRIDARPAHGRRALLVCYGPSLASTMDILKREIAIHPDADVVSVSGAHDFLLGHGIAPRFHVECDPREHKADNIDAACPSTTYLLASCVHPVLLDKLGPAADIRLWHISSVEHAARLIDEMGESADHVISGGGSVGLRSIQLLYAMGYRGISIFAMDCSFADDGQTQWAGRHFGKKQKTCQVKCEERIFTSSPTLLSYATNFWETVQRAKDLDVRLYGDGLLQAMARFYMGAPEVAHIKAPQENEAHV